MSRYISLNGAWKLSYAPEIDNERWRTIPANVPGNVEIDLHAAGYAPEPYFGDSCYEFRKYEFYKWRFERSFELPTAPGKDIILKCDGLDTICDIHINDMLAGHTENMLIGHEINISALVKPGENCIRIDIASSINHARKQYIPVGVRIGEMHGDEFTVLRRPAHSFSWDISARFISAGIWRDIGVDIRERTRLSEVYYATRSVDKYGANLIVLFRYMTDAAYLNGFSVRLIGVCGEHMFVSESKCMFVSGKMHIRIEGAKLWQVRDYGAQHLYEMTLELLKDGIVVDVRREKFGIRKVELIKRFEKNDDGEFLFKVNGTPIMVKGTNWVFLDVLHSRDVERLSAAHALLTDVGCNMARMWGGNVYEHDRFYELCDEQGILVWQDFSMACATYSQYEDFAKIIDNEAKNVIIRLRNHACIALWAGDNEVDEGYVGSGLTEPHQRYNRLTRETLPRAVQMHDPYRDYIASSPYLPEGVLDEYTMPEQHNWGPRDYFKGDFYKHTTAHFVSETGYHGCPAVSSLKKYIPGNQLWPFSLNSTAWATHSSEYIHSNRRGYDRNQLMINQVKTLFGEVPSDIEAFVLASQISQAEAKKFFIENARINKWRRTGVLWWNLIDGWPQISDAVVDYYYRKKLAYYYIRRSSQHVLIMMGEPESWGHRVVLSNDSCRDCVVKYTVKNYAGAVLLSGEERSRANENTDLKRISCIPSARELYLIEWEIDGVKYGNHYAAGYVPMDFEEYQGWLKTIEALPNGFSAKECIL